VANLRQRAVFVVGCDFDDNAGPAGTVGFINFFDKGGGGFISKLSKKDTLLYDLIVISPGVDGGRKELQYARDCGVTVMTEIEFGYMFLAPKTKVIAVTGTNGKTTTVNLIYHMLKSAGYSVAELGNIGNPMSDVYKKVYDYVVVELSSFQLEYTSNFHANIAIVLNIAPDHIDRHKTFENYKNAKLNIYRNQTKKDYAIIDFDNSLLVGEGSEAKQVTYSMAGGKAKYIMAGGIILKGKEKIISLNDFVISPVFYQDIICAIIVGDILKLTNDNFVNLVSTYSFLPHRCQLVATKNNVSYYDDSKATNIHATQHCIKLLKHEEIALLLGGRNKGLDFKDFVQNIDTKVHKIIAFGECRKNIYALRKYRKDIEFFCYKTLHDAMASMNMWNGDIDAVVLSPGCASFDEFTSYMDRGDYFRKAVVEQLNEE